MNIEPPPPSAASQSTPHFAKYTSKEGIGVITSRVITQGICPGLRLRKLQILGEITKKWTNKYKLSSTFALTDENDDNGLVSTCSLCKKQVPSCNLQLHSLRCEQQLRSQVREANETKHKEHSPGRKTPKPVKTGVKTKPPPAKQHEEDLDKLLASFTKLDTQCAYETCKQNIRTLGQMCKCCERIYCLSHHIPEVHGCGEAAKIRAKQNSSQPKSAKPKASDASRRAQLHRKLDKKLDDMSEQRRARKKGGDGKK